MSDRDILTDPQWIAFQRQLDAQPDSHATRAVLADWLEGQGHPWAKAYRWMARMRRYPSEAGWFTPQPFPAVILSHCQLPLTKDIPVSHIFDFLSRPIFDFLSRIDAEVRLCELFDDLSLVGKESDQPDSPVTLTEEQLDEWGATGRTPHRAGDAERVTTRGINDDRD